MIPLLPVFYSRFFTRWSFIHWTAPPPPLMSVSCFTTTNSRCSRLFAEMSSGTNTTVNYQRFRTRDLTLSPSGIGNFPPPSNPVTLLTNQQQEEASERLASWLATKRSVLCLTGAGLSTESGIPDYRGHQGSYHKGHKPMVHDQFLSSPSQRQRYWGRSLVGWEKFVSKQPNDGHVAITQLETHGVLGVDFDCAEIEDEPATLCIRPGRKRLSVITQNVDGLHEKAGTTYVTELHGHLNRLKCMSCGAYHDRAEFQRDLYQRNYNWIVNQEQLLFHKEQQQQQGVSTNTNKEHTMRPDGDAAVAWEDYSVIDVPPCPSCHVGFVKPDVVFFGDTVPKQRVQTCFAAVGASDGLLCIGSSLAVYSAFRFVAAAAQKGIPIAILNVGPTRAESSNLHVTKIEAPAGITLSSAAELLGIPTNSVKMAV